MPISRCKPVNAARYQDPELGRTRLFAIAVEIRERGQPGLRTSCRISEACGITQECGTWKWKGCDIGYVPAICSCEGADSVDSCTGAALDAIAAFASQTPASPRRVSRFFRVWLPYRSPCRADHSAYFGLASFISPILSAVDVDETKQSRERCQCGIQGENEISVNGNVENAVRFRSLCSPSSFPFCPTRALRRRDLFPCRRRHGLALS